MCLSLKCICSGAQPEMLLLRFVLGLGFMVSVWLWGVNLSPESKTGCNMLYCRNRRPAALASGRSWCLFFPVSQGSCHWWLSTRRLSLWGSSFCQKRLGPPTSTSRRMWWVCDGPSAVHHGMTGAALRAYDSLACRQSSGCIWLLFPKQLKKKKKTFPSWGDLWT